MCLLFHDVTTATLIVFCFDCFVVYILFLSCSGLVVSTYRVSAGPRYQFN